MKVRFVVFVVYKSCGLVLGGHQVMFLGVGCILIFKFMNANKQPFIANNKFSDYYYYFLTQVASFITTLQINFQPPMLGAEPGVGCI